MLSTHGGRFGALSCGWCCEFRITAGLSLLLRRRRKEPKTGSYRPNVGAVYKKLLFVKTVLEIWHHQKMFIMLIVGGGGILWYQREPLQKVLGYLQFRPLMAQHGESRECAYCIQGDVSHQDRARNTCHRMSKLFFLRKCSTTNEVPMH